METIKVTASGNRLEYEVSAQNATAKIRIVNNEVSFDFMAFIKGEKGDNGASGFEDIILLNGGDTYTLPVSTQGKKFIIMINTPAFIPTVVLHPGPSPVGPIHVFGPNQPKFTYITVLYVLGQYIKL